MIRIRQVAAPAKRVLQARVPTRRGEKRLGNRISEPIQFVDFQGNPVFYYETPNDRPNQAQRLNSIVRKERPLGWGESRQHSQERSGKRLAFDFDI